MERGSKTQKAVLNPDMTLLDVVFRYRETELVFSRYDEQAGACLCCEALFDPIREVARRYGLDLGRLMGDLEKAAAHGDSD